MRSILFLIERIYWNIFDAIISETKEFFCSLFSNFENLDSIFNIFKKYMTLKGDLFLNLRTPKNVVR